MNQQIDPQVVITNEVRFSYVYLNEPRTPDRGGEAEYQAMLLIPKSDTVTLDKVKAAIDAACQYAMKTPASKGGWGGEPIPNPYACIKDGDGKRPTGKEYGPECKGHWIINTKSKVSKGKPFVVTRRSATEPLISVEPRDIYSGMYGLAQVRFGPYNNSGNRGVSGYLQGIFKLRDGEPLTGVAPVAPEVSFEGVVATQAPQINPLTGLPM